MILSKLLKNNEIYLTMHNRFGSQCGPARMDTDSKLICPWRIGMGDEYSTYALIDSEREERIQRAREKQKQ